LKEDESIRRPFTMSELKSLLLVASTEWRGAILAGLYTGQRLKDIVTLCWRSIDLEHSEIRLTTSKTRRHQIIPMAKPFEDYLRSLKAGKPDAPVFPDL